MLCLLINLGHSYRYRVMEMSSLLVRQRADPKVAGPSRRIDIKIPIGFRILLLWREILVRLRDIP